LASRVTSSISSGEDQSRSLDVIDARICCRDGHGTSRMNFKYPTIKEKAVESFIIAVICIGDKV
jgi:hypothetical protein